MKEIVVFTAKDIGFSLVSFLITEFPQDNYTVIVCDPDKDKLVEKFQGNGIEAEVISRDVIDRFENLEDNSIDWLLNLWGGHIFDDLFLSKFKKTLNIHPSLLPFCRGRDPIVWALRYGFPAGVTLHEISAEIDSGAIWCQEEIEYSFPCTGEALYKRVVEKAFDFFCKSWGMIRSDVIESTPQKRIDHKIFRRTDLWADQSIDLDASKQILDFIFKVLAHDFGDDYSAVVRYQGKSYSVRFNINKLD